MPVQSVGTRRTWLKSGDVIGMRACRAFNYHWTGKISRDDLHMATFSAVISIESEQLVNSGPDLFFGKILLKIFG